MSRTETMGLTKRGTLQSSSCNRLMGRSESHKRDSVMSNGGSAKVRGSLERKKSKSFKEGESYPSWLITEAPGSIAAVRREQVAAQQALRKLKIAHYGRSKSTLTNFTSSKVVPLVHPSPHPHPQRCSFITPTSDPIYVAYHDEEWGVPVHDDKQKMDITELPRRINTLGEEPPAMSSISYHTCWTLHTALKKALHDDEYEELKESKLGGGLGMIASGSCILPSSVDTLKGESIQPLHRLVWQALPKLGANYGKPLPDTPSPPILAYKGGKVRRCFKDAILSQRPESFHEAFRRHMSVCNYMSRGSIDKDLHVLRYGFGQHFEDRSPPGPDSS
ncbi:hypothetical protein F2Q68_00017861 [Brassica cretica]|uniref:Uncharacterized protein n=1 Tax=Brassica cretica TaxID=69181 RepID=A0A8S9HMA1_BRACR|nr:hypothetical protein F2Q68_00017861 [Brassica cretica]